MLPTPLSLKTYTLLFPPITYTHSPSLPPSLPPSPSTGHDDDDDMDTEDAATSVAPKVYLPGMESGLNEGDELVYDPSAYLMYVGEGGREGGIGGKSVRMRSRVVRSAKNAHLPSSFSCSS